MGRESPEKRPFGGGILQLNLHRIGYRGLWSWVWAGIAGAAFVIPALAQELAHFDIPRQELIGALETFGRQSEQEIIFDREHTRGKQSVAVKGDFEPAAALKILLAGSGLGFRQANAHTFVVEPSDSSGETAPKNATQQAAETDQRGDELAEVVVTAEKRSENVQDVPASISVLGGAQLENLHATNLQDYAAYVPGFVVSSGGSPGQAQITLRGLNALTSTTMVATVLDDAPLGSSNGWANESSLSFDMMPYDIDRIEVLRGPQGTLYGANSMGGLLKYVDRWPDLNEFQGRVGGETFNIDSAAHLGYAGRGAFNLPLIAGKLAVRLSLYDEETPGYINNPLTGREGENPVVQRGGRISVLWRASENLSVKVQAINQQISSSNNASVIENFAGQSPNPSPPQTLNPTVPPYYFATGPRDGDLTHGHPLNEPFTKDVSFLSSNINWSLGWADFTSVSSFANTVTKQALDASNTYGTLVGALAAFHDNLSLRRFTQEFRLASPSGGDIEWLAGSYYSYEDSKNFQFASALDANQVPIAGLDPIVTDSIPTLYREFSLFGDVTYKLTSSLDVTGGLRWAKNIQGYEEIVNGESGLIFQSSTTSGSSAQGVFTWVGSSRYHFDKDNMAYVRVATGYRPGGPNSTLNVPGVPSQVNADTLINYEAGIKSQFLHDRALIDLTVFRIDWKNIQLTAASANNTYGVNGGTASSQGIELATMYSPVRGLQLGLNAAFTDAKLTENVPVSTVHWLNGAQLPNAPKWTSSLTADYEFSLPDTWRGRVGGGYRYVGPQFSDVQSATLVSRLPGYSVVDLNAGIERGPWDIKLYVKNFANKRAYINQSVSPDLSGNPLYIESVVLQPRTIGISTDFSF